MFNKSIFVYSIALILAAEALSFLSFYFPNLGNYWFAWLAIIAVIATAYKLEWGIMILLAELIIGSKGYIFSLSFGGIEISIRIALWLIIVSFWLARAVRTRRVGFNHSQFFKLYALLAAVIVWAFAWGLVRHDNFGTVFFDVNNYLYFVLIFPLYEALSTERSRQKIIVVMTAAVSYLTIKTILLFYIFSHSFPWLRLDIYAWSRKRLLAEIASTGAELPARIFAQSQIFILFGLFVSWALFLHCYRRGEKSAKNHSLYFAVLAVIMFSAAVVVSFSRSFWAAAVLTFIILFAALIKFLRAKPFVTTLKLSGLAVVLVVNGIALSAGLAAFPYPKGAAGGVEALAERTTSVTDEAAANTRYSLFRPLLRAIAVHPVIGSGFGSEVTYQSQDPRVLATHPGGWYTTTAFEWGWLDIWLKIGLAGLMVYLYLLWRIGKALWFKFKSSPPDSAGRFIAFGALFGFIALLLTNGVSPYLNHPLGIGLVMLATGFAEND